LRDSLTCNSPTCKQPTISFVHDDRRSAPLNHSTEGPASAAVVSIDSASLNVAPFRLAGFHPRHGMLRHAQKSISHESSSDLFFFHFHALVVLATGGLTATGNWSVNCLSAAVKYFCR
jgi:hypothetical protein